MDLVREARRGELKGFEERKVYSVRPRYEATQKGAKIVGVRWLDTRKGSGVRSRLVCTDFNRDKVHTDDMFAHTPPIVASRWLVSECASNCAHGLGDSRLMSIDFTKAFLYGEMEREVYVELPDEDGRKESGANIGLLRKAMYGLSDATLIWQKLVKKMLNARGFRTLVTAQCVYFNPSTKVLIVGHVDDLLCEGPKQELIKLLKSLQEEYACGGDILGPGQGEVRELKFLGRRIGYTSEGLEWEDDDKHVKSFLEKVGLDKPKRAVTPGTKRDEVEQERKALGAKEAKNYRGVVALPKFMSRDRCDISFALKEVSKFMSSPAECDVGPLK